MTDLVDAFLTEAGGMRGLEAASNRVLEDYVGPGFGPTRDFNGASYIEFTPGALTGMTYGSLAAVFKLNGTIPANDGWTPVSVRSTVPNNAFEPSLDTYDGALAINMYIDASGNAGVATSYPTGWALGVFTKATGTQPRKLWLYSFDTGTWIVDGLSTAGTLADSVRTVGAGIIGAGRAGSSYEQWFKGSIAGAAVWKNRVLTDTEVKTLKNDWAAWAASSPTSLWVLNQSSTATAVIDRVGTSPQSALVGTTISADLSPLDEGTVLRKGAGVFHEAATASTIPADLALLDTSWWYDWASYSVPGITTKPSTPGIEYVPMMWGDWIDDARWGSATGDGSLGGNSASSIGSATTLLGFNEPDIEEQADMTVARALALWPDLEATGARLGSPAPSGTPDQRGLTWLADFMDGAGAYVPRVDFICAHWYVEWNLGFANIADFLDYLHTTYPTKPIWLSEVGVLTGTQSANAALMSTVMSALATRPWVERVAWYVVTRNVATGYDPVRLTTTGGALSTSGTTWASYPDKVSYGEPGATVPGAPTGLGATAADASAALSWTAPASNGGAAITDYTVQYRTTAGPGSWNTFSHSANTATSILVTGLTNATGYDFQVAAVNSVGTSAYSSTASATPAPSGGGGPAWSYDFTDDANGAMPSTLTYWGGSLTGRIASGHFMCDVDWYTTKVYDTAIANQDATTHLVAAEVSFRTTTGQCRLYFASNADMTSFDEVTFNQDGTWLVEYEGGGSSGSPALPAFTVGATYKLVVTYNESTAAYEVFVNDVSRATGTFPWPKTGNRSGFMVNGNLDMWVTKFYYGPQSAGVPGTGGAATVPGAPTGLGATAGDAQVSLAWTAPASNGGAAITDYTVQYRTTAGPGSWNTFSHSASTATAITVTGLTNSTGYDFQVAAVNSVGTGTYSTTASATPVVVQPTIVATQISGGAAVSTVTKPAGGTTGDHYVILVQNQNRTVSVPTFGATGFTAVGAVTGANNASFGNYWYGGLLVRPYDGSEGSSFSVTGLGGEWTYLTCHLVRNALSFIMGTYAQGGSGSLSLPAISPSAGNTLGIISGSDWDPTTWTASGWTEVTKGTSNAAPTLTKILSAGSTGSVAVSATSASRHAGFLAAALTVPPPPVGLTATWHTSDQGGFNSGNGAPPVTLTVPSWSVTAGDLLVLYIGAEFSDGSVADPPFTVTGGGLTWTQRIRSRNGNPFAAQTAIFTAVATSTTSITGIQVSTPSALTVSYGAQKFSGQHASPIGAVFADNANAGTSGVMDFTLPSTPLASSYIGACMYINTEDTNATKKIDHGASDGWTELMDNGSVMNGTGRWGLFEVQGKTGHVITRVRWDSTYPAGATYTTYSWSGCAIEIKSA